MIEPQTEREEVVALSRLLREALIELEYLRENHPRAASTAAISSILERGKVALRTKDLRAVAHV